MPAIAHDKAQKLSLSIRPFHFNKEETLPVRKKKRTTSENAPSMSEQPSLQMLEQQEFQQHLRALAQSAVGTVVEIVMREELDAFIGAAWGESNPKRKGYRNGSYTRDLVTSTGRLEEIKVPRDREGQFHTQTFERYNLCWLLGTSVQEIGLFYTMKQTFLPKHVGYEYNQKNPFCVQAPGKRSFSRRRGSIRAACIFLDQATRLFYPACVPRRCFAADQSTDDLPCVRHTRRFDQ
jgi:hypothetical protein